MYKKHFETDENGEKIWYHCNDDSPILGNFDTAKQLSFSNTVNLVLLLARTYKDKDRALSMVKPPLAIMSLPNKKIFQNNRTFALKPSTLPHPDQFE